jgi:hypothetical protein
MEKIVIEMTSFIFEDGNTYYFQIYKRESSNDYHNLFVYEKVEYKTWYGSNRSKYNQLNYSPELICVKLDSKEIKTHIIKILTGTKAVYKIKDWDGFVGDIPDEAKKSLSRNDKLNDLGI